MAYGAILGKSTTTYTNNQILSSSDATLLGLSSTATPSDMFNVLANVGDLYVWKRTTSSGTDYPVSTNPNAYQTGSDAQPAGYTLGEVVTGSFILTNKLNSSNSSGFRYGEYTVSDSGELSIPEPEGSVSFFGYESEYTKVQNLLGKKTICTITVPNTNFREGTAYYFPSDAIIIHEGGTGNSGYWVIDRYQPVTGYPAIPAVTTIEYMGQVGDKARIVTGSYVGTGTYGENNPNTLEFGFIPKLVIVSNKTNTTSFNYWFTAFFYYGVETIQYYRASGSPSASTAYGGTESVSWNLSILNWFNSSSAMGQLNASGNTYYYIAIG